MASRQDRCTARNVLRSCSARWRRRIALSKSSRIRPYVETLIRISPYFAGGGTGHILVESGDLRRERPCARKRFRLVMLPCDTTIFIIDDDEPVRDSMKVLLESYDMTVRDFASCGDFLEAP